MKHESQESEFAHSYKRPRYDGRPNDNPQDRRGGDQRKNYNSNHNSNYAKPRQNASKEKRPYTVQQSGHSAQQASSAPSAPSPISDPATTLETLLRSLVTHPDAVQTVLGTSALENATSLLASLTSRDKSAKSTLDLFQPETENTTHPEINSYTPTQPIRAYPIPPLPSVPEGPYSRAVFIHKSTTQHDRVSGASDLTYEKLEFLGDAYIEIIATRIIFARYPDLPAGRQAQTRERIVKNETLSQFSVAYGFRERIVASDIEHSSKAATKILADVFEAYVAAVVLSDPAAGFQRAEEWLTELWAPILLEGLGSGSEQRVQSEYNGNAKQDLQKKVLGGSDAKLEYLEERPMEQSKHAQKYFIGLYLTGYGCDKMKIGYGEGRNKVEAGNRAAMLAMEQHRELIDKAFNELAAHRERKRLEKERAQVDGGQAVKTEDNGQA